MIYYGRIMKSPLVFVQYYVCPTSYSGLCVRGFVVKKERNQLRKSIVAVSIQCQQTGCRLLTRNRLYLFAQLKPFRRGTQQRFDIV